MSTRSRAHPWFTVDLLTRAVWATPGGYLCEHRAVRSREPWRDPGCLACDMNVAFRIFGVPSHLL